MLLNRLLYWTMDHVVNRCSNCGLLEDQDHDLLEEGKRFSSLSHSWLLSTAFLPFAYYFPVSSFVITALPLTLFIFTYVAFWAFGSSCLRFDRAIHQFLKVLAVADASKFAIDGKTASSGVMQEQRVEVLMQLRRVYGQLAHLSDEVVLTSAESSSLWNNIIADECLRLARDTVAEGYTDQKSLKTLWQLTFLCRSQLIALIIRRLTKCTCGSELADNAIMAPCECELGGCRSVVTWFTGHVDLLRKVVLMAYGIRMEAGLCPAGRVLRRKQGPKVIKGDNNELTKAKVLLSMAAEKLEEVTALTDVPENVTKIIKEALSILDTPQRNQPNVIEQSKLKVRTNEPAEKPPAPKEVDRVIPDYQVFVGVNDDDNFKPQATDYDEFDFELVKKNHALMDELAAALAVPAQTHKERERQACLGEEEEEEVEAESSENEESEVEEFRHSVFSPPNLAQELNSVFVGAPRFGGASLLKDILASSAMVRNQQQEDTFGDSDDSDDDGN